MDNKTIAIAVAVMIILMTIAWFTLMGQQFSQQSGLLGLVGETQQGNFSESNTTRANETANQTIQDNTDLANITAENETDKLICEYPYVMIGSSCCVDFNSNDFCDVGEPKVQPHHSSSCSSPYSRVNGTCCVDQNGNNICDSNEIPPPPNVTCESPYIHFGTGCCLDQDNDSACDSNETTCESPYARIGSRCCIDANNNNICDDNETNQTCNPPLIPFNGTCCPDANNDSVCDGNRSFNGTFADIHAHISSEVQLGQAIEMMDRLHVAKMVIMEPPATTSQDASSEYHIPDAAEQYPDRFIVLYGGEAKAMLEANADNQELGEEDTRAFADLLDSAMETKKYRGFGEIGLLHFGHGEGEEGGDLLIPGNHPWMFIMSDMAAKYKVPIDIHMEATNDSIKGFEELLDHNQSAKIIWDHAGWSNTGMATPQVLGKMMHDHPNLYASIKVRKPKTGEMAAASIMYENGTIKEGWLKLFTDYPDRFMIGSDVKLGFGDDNNASEIFEAHQRLLEQLPEDIVKKIGTENSQEVFGRK